MGNHLNHPSAIRRPWAVRRCPSDFPAVYIEGGWFAVELEYGANWKTIMRWIEECGGEDLRQARKVHMRNNRAKASVAARRLVVE